MYFSVCGRTLQDSIGIFSHSPTPEKEELCQWRISATHGEKIVLNITALDIPITGRAGSGNECDADYLEVRDGYYVMSPLLGMYWEAYEFQATNLCQQIL